MNKCPYNTGDIFFDVDKNKFCVAIRQDEKLFTEGGVDADEYNWVALHKRDYQELPVAIYNYNDHNSTTKGINLNIITFLNQDHIKKELLKYLEEET